GFYAVYKKVFDTLAREDYDFIEDPNVHYPSFGDASSDYDTVTGPFYGFWSSFCTARSFAWLDKYDVRQANNRYELRQIEAENKKYREAGKAERNDQIRELVAFVRKRDPRIKAYREFLKNQQEEAKRKQEENRRQQILKNQQLLSAFHENEFAMAAHRAHLEEISQQLADEETCSETENEDGDALPYCVVCDKSFKSWNAKNNHDNSKQHRKQLAELKKHMKEEDHALFEGQSTEEVCEEKNVDRKGKREKRRAKKKNKDEDELYTSYVDNQQEGEANPVDADRETDELNTMLGEASLKNDEENDKNEEENNVQAKKKKRRADKKQGDTAAPREAPPANTGPKIDVCHKCKEVFESRTKLFDHLKLTGHATIKTTEPQPPPKNKKGRRK
ncbi:unnamed protein product, partial [Nippostrongylus brasiliensis]|uniref:DnaJ homolog subfamily C member 21 (inferred by orthology to a human protein) n=1 Tax=Nippostrongylus brasiliensis TaxID=27835 RepID=A0A0N4Y7C2_NIPBR